MNPSPLTAIELCAGGGGQLLGLEKAGFESLAAVEIDHDACNTLRLNRPALKVVEGDLREFSAKPYEGVDLLAGGVPCPPFSIAGKQLGKDDERDLFPEALRLVRECSPSAVMLENVRGFASAKFTSYRSELFRQLHEMGYLGGWRVLHASDYGVPQLRPRFILVAIKEPLAGGFAWPKPLAAPAPTVAESIGDLMASNKWPGIKNWRKQAASIAPTIVGGSKKHGGPDLGPSRAKARWAELGVSGKSIAEDPPDQEFPKDELPRLTTRMVARIQSFPDSWEFSGKKTAAYRQVGNAFPPLVAAAVASAIARALRQEPLENDEGHDLFPASFLTEIPA